MDTLKKLELLTKKWKKNEITAEDFADQSKVLMKELEKEDVISAKKMKKLGDSCMNSEYPKDLFGDVQPNKKRA